MSDEIKKLNEEIAKLRNLRHTYMGCLAELLMIPEVKDFCIILFEGEQVNKLLKQKEKEYTLKSMQECEHAFVITEIVRDAECGCIRRTPVYHCVKCGLTNEYDVKEVNALVDEIKSQMTFIFGDTSMNGVLLSNEMINLIDAIDVYKGITSTNPNITNSELKKQFCSAAVKKLTLSKNT